MPRLTATTRADRQSTKGQGVADIRNAFFHAPAAEVPGYLSRLMREKALKAFLLTATALAVPAALSVLRMDKYHLHLAMNSFHGPLPDAAFPVLTELANGFVPAILAVLLLFQSWRSFLMMGLSTGLSALVVQFLKRAVFNDHDRPAMFLDHMGGLHTVAGVDLHHYFSFPSGHSTAAFSMCLALAVVIGKRPAAVVLALFAALLAYSRVYLSQHFTEDILAGAIVGCLVGAAVYMFLYRGAWGRRSTLDRSPFLRQNQ